MIFIGTPAFAVPSLRRLADAGYEIAAVVTQPDRPAGRGRRTSPPAVKDAALALGLPVLQPRTLKDDAAVDDLRRLEPELMVAVAYGQILRRDVLAIPQRGVLNVHPSLLPRWRGASPITAPILAGDAETGVTIMLMDEGMDSGPVLAQRTHPLSPRDTTATLTPVLAELGASLLAETIPGWVDGSLKATPQDESLATVTRPIKKEDGVIDWATPAVEIWRQVRAYDPWPGAYSFIAGETVHVWSAWPIPADQAAVPGTVILPPRGGPAEASGAAFAVQTGSGALAIIEAQRAGRKRLASADLLRGWPELMGSVFQAQ